MLAVPEGICRSWLYFCYWRVQSCLYIAVKRVNVEQLEQVLTASQHKPDSKAAQQLSGLELTERLSPARLAYWESALPGPESRRALAVIADISAFLDPTAAEIPAMSPPISPVNAR